MHQTHLDEEQIQRVLHRELEPGAAQAVQHHLAACSECRSRLLQAELEEGWVLDRLRGLDHRLPPVTASSIINRRTHPVPIWGRWAAGMILALGIAGVAYAAPGSPLPGALKQLAHLIAPPRQPASKPIPPSNPEEAQAGIAVVPGERLTIDFAARASADTAVVSLVDGTEVVARAPTATAIFSSDTDRLVIRHEGPPTRFEILVPRVARWISVTLGDRRLWLKSQSRILSNTRPDAQGRYVLPLSQKVTQ